MNYRNANVLLASTAMAMMLPTVAFGAEAPAAGIGAADEEIIVTARRADEKLQDVPVSVQAISGSQLQKLAITQTEEISKLAPGLTLVNAGSSAKVTLRGVTWQPGSGTPATPIYFNEVPFDPGNTIVSMFDIGQIEVLRGPQGTSRGAPSISGAITMVTTKPNLSEFGGYVQGLYGEANHWDVQAAINLPVIKDMLAIRLATNIENSEGNRVYSVNSKIKPKRNDRSFRATVLFKPTDTLTLEAMYQRRTSDNQLYAQVAGTGSPGAAASPVAFLGALGAIPANFNGPALTLAQRAAVDDAPGNYHDQIDFLTVNATWQVLGQQLSYNYGKQIGHSAPSYNTQDVLNMLPGTTAYLINGGVPGAGPSGWRTHELRLSSGTHTGHVVEYDIGWFSKHSGGTLDVTVPTFLAGAFGPPTALPGQFTTPNPAYTLNSDTNIYIGQSFDSFYGDLKFHIDHNTELTAGIAQVKDRVPVDLNVTTFAALNNIGNLNVVKLGFPAAFQSLITSCAVVGAFAKANIVSSTAYPGTCDAVVAAGVGNSVQHNNDSYSATLYNFSLSHKFSDDVMVYATTGSSFRTGLPAINNTGLPASLTTPLPEKAKSYEIGIKTSWGRKLHVNAAVFQIDYGNQLTTFQGVPYWSTVSNKVATTSIAFYRNIDSRVRGFELEIGAQPTHNLSLGLNLSYSQIKSKGGSVPCNNGTVTQATPNGDLSVANPIDYCPSVAGQVLNQDAPFGATLNGSYTQPLGSVDGYLRFNLSYKGGNPNYGNFATITNGVSTFQSTPGYAIVDLFVGVTGQKGAWDLALFAKNVFNKQQELSRFAPLNNIYSPYAVAPSGYNTVSVTLPREIGVTLRYAFGSH